MEELLENENVNENLGKIVSDGIQEAPFKKPILIGKFGRLPRKIQTVASNKIYINSTEISAEKNTQDNFDMKAESSAESSVRRSVEESVEPDLEEKNTPGQQILEHSIPSHYKEPSWSGFPQSDTKPYVFEVLKNGSIIETINLMKKPFWIFGRLANCDICMQHPTISRYHAVLQYRDIPSESEPPGFYIYDLGSTHGTFLNNRNNKVKPKIYLRVHVGHMLRFGCSQRSYILTGPEDDQEDESEFTVTELKQLKEQKLKEHEENIRQVELERLEKKEKEEERGIDWGLGDDADETEDLLENPFAQTNNEELYLDDPKKALRGFFEREGHELEYDCNEQGLGQFLCKVKLPLNDEMGRPVVAEVLHRGKKKEAVVQCALEACRILDRLGILKQATHESRKRKAKNWEEDDYYDSDDDTFLDRTGTVEKKREKRMKAKEPEKPETYETLLEKEKSISNSISELEIRLARAQKELNKDNAYANSDEDSLDSYMSELKHSKSDKHTVSKLKMELIKLKKDHANIIRLANIAKPANMPVLTLQTTVQPSTSHQLKPTLPIIGKRKKIPVQFPQKPILVVAGESSVTTETEAEEEEEEETESGGGCGKDKGKEGCSDGIEDKIEPEQESKKSQLQNDCIVNIDNSDNAKNDLETVKNTEEHAKENYTKNIVQANNVETSSDQNKEITSSASTEHSRNISSSVRESQILAESYSQTSQDNMEVDSESQSDSDDDSEVRRVSTEILELRPIKSFHETLTFKKFENIMRAGLPPFAGKHKEKLEKILIKLKRLASNEDRMHVDWKILSAKKRKVMKLISDLRNSQSNEKLEYQVSSELNRILSELNIMTEEKFKVIGKVKKMGNELKNISIEIDKDIQALKQGMNDVSDCNTSKNHSDDGDSPKAGPSNENAESALDADEKKKRRNQKRIEQRQQKAEIERQRGYQEDSTRENYSMWVPPNDQVGDGRTSLNDKFGY